MLKLALFSLFLRWQELFYIVQCWKCFRKDQT